MSDQLSARDKYKQWCSQVPDLPVFSHGWWLDAACGANNWDVLVYEENGVITASFPYYLKRRGVFRLITMPPLTQTMGPYISYPEGTSHGDRLSRDKRVLTNMITLLPQYDHLVVNCCHRVTNFLPFHWAGFHQQTHYTYVIPDLSDLDRVLAAFDYAKRKDIKKAQKVVTVEFDIGSEAFYRNHEMTLAKQGSRISYSFDLFKRLHDAAYARNAGRTIAARDKDGNLHAALFVVWSKEAAYDLVSTIDPDFRNSGAASLLVQEIIRYVSAFTNRFDFEGSMIEGVEASFRKFGSVQTPYFTLSKTPSLFLRMRAAALQLMNP